MMRSPRLVRLVFIALPFAAALMYPGLSSAQGPGHTISGILAESPGCMGAERGWTVALDPGLTTTTSLGDGSFSFSNVSDGSYTLDPLPPCNPFGCWDALPVTVAGADQTNLKICLHVLATPTPLPPCTPAPTPTGPAPTPPPTPQTPIPGGPDLVVTISGPPPYPTPVAPGDPLTFVISVWNLGDAAASPVEVVGPDVGAVAVQPTQGSCALFPNGSYGFRLSCDLGTLDPPGGPGESSAAIVLSGPAPDTGRAPGLGVIRTNTVTMDPDNKVAESNESNNTASVTYFLVVPDATPTPTPSIVASAAVGGIVEYPRVESEAATGSHSSALPAAAHAGVAAGSLLLLLTGGWCARRRFGRH